MAKLCLMSQCTACFLPLTGSYNSNPWTNLAGLSGNGCADCPGQTTTQKEGTDDVSQCNRKFALSFYCQQPMLVWIDLLPTASINASANEQ